MADIKFSCGHCEQHISCDELWAGHQIQCPACKKDITVPTVHVPPAAAVPDPRSLVPQPSATTRPKLSAGLTQVAARATPAVATSQRRLPPRAPKTTNPAVRYAAIALVLVVVGIAAVKYVPGLLGQVQEVIPSKPSGAATGPAVGGGGPLGEVNGAMDVSDALDGGSSRPRPSPAKRTLATNSAPKSPNGSH